MKLNRTRIGGLAFALAACAGLGTGLPRAAAQTQPAAGTQPAAAPKYTKPEYDAEQAAAAEKNPQTKIKLLDDFVAKYPNSDLLIYVYPEYVKAYTQTRNWPKLVEAYDKLLSFPTLDAPSRIEALFRRSATVEFAITSKDPNFKEELTKARDAAAEGLKLWESFPKPASVTDEQYQAYKKQTSLQFHNTIGFADIQLKEFNAAVGPLKAALALEQNQPLVAYRLGQAYLLQTPPQSMDGFWYVARAIALKIPNEASVQKFLRAQMINYQLSACENQIDPQIKELLALAAASPDRPASYSIPSAADLAKARESANIETVLADLKAGGDKGKITWLSVCSGEFPEALAKAYEVTPGTNLETDPVMVKAFVGTKQEEVEASTAPNAELKIVGQQAAVRLEKDTVFRFGGALVDYTPDPYLIRWDKVKVNEEDIPAAKAPPKKAGKAPAKHPAKKRPPL